MRKKYWELNKKEDKCCCRERTHRKETGHYDMYLANITDKVEWNIVQSSSK